MKTELVAEDEPSAQQSAKLSKAETPSRNRRWFAAHSVSGGLILIPLFIIIATGTITFFHKELVAWQSPELRRPAPEAVTELDHLIGPALSDVPEEARSMRVNLPNQWLPMIKLEWWLEGEDEAYTRLIDPTDGTLLDENKASSRFADHIYQWHFLNPLPMGLEIAGLIALIWFSLTVSGVYMHRRKLWSQFGEWKNRKDRSLKSWIHTTTATLTLPLHLIYGVTGAFFGLTKIALPLFMFIGFGGDQEKMMSQFSPDVPQPEFTEATVAIPPLDPFIAKTLETKPDVRLLDLFIEKPHNEGARMHMHFEGVNGGKGEALYDIHKSQTPLFIGGMDEGPMALQILYPVITLHFGNFGGVVVQVIYAIGGILLAMLVYAAARMWVMRKQKDMPRSAKIVERLFDGFALGILPAIAIYAWANRLLPSTVASRSDVEIMIFHGSWIVIGLLILAIGTSSLRRRILMYGTVVMLAIVPFFDGLLLQHWPWSAASWHVPSVGIINILLILGAVVCFAFPPMRKKARPRTR